MARSLRFLLCITLSSWAVPGRATEALANRIEQVVISSPQAEALFGFLTQDLGLPEVWPYSDFGSFRSGGVSLGNAVLDLSHSPSGATRYSALALEPQLDAASLTEALPERGIGSTGPQPFSVNIEGKTVVLWNHVTLPGFEPKGARIFFCDYSDRKAARRSREQARARLLRSQGGPLGLLSLKQVNLGLPAAPLPRARLRWSALGRELSGDLLRFSQGPALRLHPVRQDSGILSLVVQVRALAQAEAWLRARGWAQQAADGGLLLAAPALRGLRLRLE